LLLKHLLLNIFLLKKKRKKEKEREGDQKKARDSSLFTSVVFSVVASFWSMLRNKATQDEGKNCREKNIKKQKKRPRGRFFCVDGLHQSKQEHEGELSDFSNWLLDCLQDDDIVFFFVTAYDLARDLI
jgi:hypothetical protein